MQPRWFAYGNYIDETLMMGTNTSVFNLKLYVHDHLFSPVALVQRFRFVLQERYEYDAYGNATILDPQYAIRNTSLYNNPYLFTGRRLDILDNGSLKLQYNRNRYYDQYTGRWLTHDPLGMSNQFLHQELQYFDGMNLYQYVHSNPANARDPFGLLGLDSLRDIHYLGRFIWHRYYGRGAIWTDGAENLRRQDLLKFSVSLRLSTLATRYCEDMKKAGTCSASGNLREMLTGSLCNTYGMLWSLNGPNPAFVITGRYHAFLNKRPGECSCTAVFNNTYTWLDKGDLNPKHLSDRIYRYLEILGYISTPLPAPRDFNVFIKWRDTSYFFWSVSAAGGNTQAVHGWPFE